MALAGVAGKAYGASKVWTLVAGDGVKTVYVQFKNNAEMTSGSYTDTIILDTVAPTGSVLINGGAAYTNSTAVNLTLSASDAGSGVYQMRFSNDGASWSGWEAYGASKAWMLAAGDGLKTVYVQYRDTVGNGSGSYTDTIFLDTTAPTGSVLINGGAAYTNSTSVNLTLSASDAGSGIYQMRFSNDGASWSGWEAYGASKAWTLAAGDGLKTVYVQYRDTVGNGSGSYTDTIILDTVAPTGSVLINGGAAYTNSTAVNLTLSASDAGSGVYQMRFSNDGASWSGWEAYGASKAWMLAAGDGLKTVYVQYRDTVGNGSGSYTDTIFLDTTAPTGSVLINGGAAYTNSTSVNLTLSASDAGSGVYQMRFSNDGASWSGWEAYGASKAWTFAAGDSLKTVYVQYNDYAGYTSISYTDTITLDTVAPVSSASSPANSPDFFFTVSWSGSDVLSAIASYDVQYKVGAAGVWVDWLHSTTATSEVFGPISPVLVQIGETYYFQVRARDNAGNEEAYPGGDGDTSTFVLLRVYIPIIDN